MRCVGNNLIKQPSSRQHKGGGWSPWEGSGGGVGEAAGEAGRDGWGCEAQPLGPEQPES